MGIRLSELETGSKITLHLSSGSHHMEMDAAILRPIQDHLSLISLCYDSAHSLNFENVKIEMEYFADDGTPYLWKTCQITSTPAGYVLQVKGDGIRHNRRECFRVGVSCPGRMRIAGRGDQSVMVRDVSLSGFSIADRKKNLHLETGNEVSLHFEDLAHNLNLIGKVVRTEEREDMTIYGFVICNLCKDLPSYVTAKQRQKRNG